MAARYRETALRRVANLGMRGLLALGLAPPAIHLLTVRGRRTRLERSTPVQIVALGGERWLVAPYGVRQWVRNVRAAREVTLTRRGRSERLRIDEAPPAQAGPVLREYARRVRLVRPYFDARLDGPAADWEREAATHPVFRLTPAPFR